MKISSVNVTKSVELYFLCSDAFLTIAHNENKMKKDCKILKPFIYIKIKQKTPVKPFYLFESTYSRMDKVKFWLSYTNFTWSILELKILSHLLHLPISFTIEINSLHFKNLLPPMVLDIMAR